MHISMCCSYGYDDQKPKGLITFVIFIARENGWNNEISS